jgi:tetratricopeptide (TPR) repeat protein
MDYGAPVVHSLAAVWPQALLLVGLAAGTLWALRRHPAAGFVGACFFVVLAPSSSFVPLTTQTIAEHRMYLPVLCVILPAVLLLWRQIARFAALICGLLAITAVGLTWQRNAVYATRLSIWTDTAAAAPDNYRAHYNLGNARVAAGQPAAAVPSFEAALRLKPDDGTIAYNLASVLQQLGRDAEAVGYFEIALRHGPEASDTHANLAVALARTGRIDEAVTHFRRATALEPKAPDLHFSLAQALRLQGRIPEAVQEYRTVLQLEPRHGPARAALAEITGNPR